MFGLRGMVRGWEEYGSVVSLVSQIFSEGSHSYRSVTLPRINIECHTLETSLYGGVITFSILVNIILPIEG